MDRIGRRLCVQATTSRINRPRCRSMLARVTLGELGALLAVQPGPVKNSLTSTDRQDNLDAVEVVESARRHGFSDAEILHAFENAIRLVEFDYQGEDRLLVLGATPDGTLLELVAIPVDGPARIIHADRLRAKFYDYLR